GLIDSLEHSCTHSTLSVAAADQQLQPRQSSSSMHPPSTATTRATVQRPENKTKQIHSRLGYKEPRSVHVTQLRSAHTRSLTFHRTPHGAMMRRTAQQTRGRRLERCRSPHHPP